MPSRNRSRDRSAISAGKQQLIRVSDGAVIQQQLGYAGSTWHETCADTTMAPPYVTPHALSIVSMGCHPPLRINGSQPSILGGAYKAQWTNYDPTNRASWAYSPGTVSQNFQYWKNKALANMSPYKSAVDLPLFLFEFKDFPSMLRNLGDVLSKKVSPAKYPEGYLAYSFGWAPLVSDLRTLAKIQKSVDDRIRYWRKLETGTHIRRKLGEGVLAHSITSDGYTVLSAYGNPGTALKADVVYTVKQKAWFTANAKLIGTLPAPSNQQAAAMRTALGLTLSPTTLWNMMPWSWLIDYFFAIGDFMEATRGMLNLSIPSMCVMVRTESRSFLQNVRMAPGLTREGGDFTTLQKDRSVSLSPYPFVTTRPFLSLGQVANLGALGTVASLKSVPRFAK